MNIHKKLALLLALALTLAITVAVRAQGTSTTSAPTVYWRAEYFNNADLSGAPALVRVEPTIDNNWGDNSPAPGVINPDQFAARWTRTLDLTAGRYLFTATADDGVRLWVNNQPLIDQWIVHQAQSYTATVDLPSGAALVRMEYFDNGGAAVARLAWTPIGAPTQPSASNGVVTAIVTGTQNLNVRSGPGTRFTILTTVPSGQLVAPQGRNVDASWLQLTLADGRTGWISALYLTPNLALTQLPVVTVAQTAVASIAPTAVVTGTPILNVRSGPDTGSTLVTTLNSGQIVLLQGRSTDNVWLQVRLPDGQLGWVSSLYVAPAIALTDVPVASATQPANVGGEANGVVVGAGILNVRSGPGTGSNLLTTLADGQTVGLEGRNADASWLKLRLADGSLGWVSSLYVIPNLLRTDLPIVQ